MGFVQPGFVVAIIHNGKIIREQNSDNERTVRIPFGSEYQIRIWNKTRARAFARVMIDGTEVVSGKLILSAGEKMDLERFVIDGDMSKGSRFKFVEAGNSAVQDPTAKENGELEVIFEPEDDRLSRLSGIFTGQIGHSGIGGSASGGGILRGMSFNSQPTFGGVVNSTTTGATMDSLDISCSTGDKGATVEGSQSTQAFMTSHVDFPTLAPVSLKIRIRGPKTEQPKVYGGGEVSPTWQYNGQVAGGLMYCGKVVKGIQSVKIDGEGVHVTIPLSAMTFR